MIAARSPPVASLGETALASASTSSALVSSGAAARAAAIRWFASSGSPWATAIAAARMCSAAAASGIRTEAASASYAADSAAGSPRRDATSAAPSSAPLRVGSSDVAVANDSAARSKSSSTSAYIQPLSSASAAPSRGVGGAAGERRRRLEPHHGVGATGRQVGEAERGARGGDRPLLAARERAEHVRRLVELPGALERAPEQPLRLGAPDRDPRSPCAPATSPLRSPNWARARAAPSSAVRSSSIRWSHSS